MRSPGLSCPAAVTPDPAASKGHHPILKCGDPEIRINVGGHEAVAAVPRPPELVEVVSDIRRRAAGKPH